ncbi:MAG: aldehyde dehydrogenase family protein [Candidatus Aenigmarchaeota archaeon]|nr:aldehyde dehydrogenase family protein [Candidatus Aenigmarchaeota archaeon]
MQEHKIYIDGQWVKSESGRTFLSLDPATERPIGKFQQGNENDVKKAIDAAEDAYHKWSEIPAPKRGEVLLKVAELLKKEKQRLGKLVATEMGKVMPEALGDVQEAIDVFEYMAGEGRRLYGHTTPSELKDKFAMTIRMPLGVVGLITPWNFPIAIPSWKLAPALICGNGIVLKPSSDTPLCAIELVKILEKAGIPKGVVNLVTGPGDTAGKELIKNDKVRGISFTGNKDTGEWILKEAGLKKVGLELGGKNAIIIMPDADLNLALEGALWGGFGTTGQRCTAASRVIIDRSVQKIFERNFVDRARRLKLGAGYDKKSDVGPLINKYALEKTHKYTLFGLAEGAKLLTGGRRFGSKGFFYEPTIFTDVSVNMRIAKEEIFGPTVSLIPVNGLDEAIEAVNSVEYGLSSSIYTNNIRNAFKAIEKIETGITYVNASTIGAEVHLPFGGMRHTGNGTREAGIEGINEFSETKTVYIDYSGRLQKAQIDVVKD